MKASRLKGKKRKQNRREMLWVERETSRKTEEMAM